jgi:hypothetical protein
MVEPAWGNFQTPNQVNTQKAPPPSKAEPATLQTEEAEQPPNPPQWGQFDNPSTHQAEPEESDEGWLSFFGRQVTRGASRVGEQVLGAYGNIEKFGKEALTAAPKYLGPVGDAIYDLVGEKGWEKIIKGSQPDTQMFPTSQRLKEVSEKVSGGLTTPQTKEEEKLDQFLEDVGSTINPRGRLSLARNFTIPAAANAAKELADYIGLGDDAANKIKMAVWLPMMLSHNVNGPQHASNLMNEGRNGIPNTVQMNTQRFTTSLDNVERSLLTADPRTAVARQLLGGLRNDLANGQTSAQSLMTMYDAVNAAKRSRGMFELGRADRVFATRAVDQVRHAVRNELMQSAAAYPQALNSWQNGVRAWATVHRSNAITNWVQDQAKGPYGKSLAGPALGLFGVGSYKISQLPPIVSAELGAKAYALGKSAQILYRAIQDPTLARYYYGAISGAMQENLPAFLNNYNRLNKKLEEQPKK